MNAAAPPGGNEVQRAWMWAALSVPILTGTPSLVDAQSRPFALADMASIVGLSDPQISPDGRHVAVVVSHPDVKTDKPKVEIDVIDVATGASRALTQNRTGLVSPRWSPDGRRLAFIAEIAPAKPDPDAPADTPPPEGKAQIFVASMDGGDPLRLTSSARDVLSFAWAPDGARIAYISADEPPNAAAIKAHDDAFEVTDNNFLARKAETPSHLWIVPSTGGASVRVTSGGQMSLHTDQRDQALEPAFSPDGRTVAFTRFPGPWEGPAFRSDILQAPVGGGAVTDLVPDKGAQELKFAPVGGLAAYSRSRGGDQSNGEAIYVLEGGRSTDVTASLRRNIRKFAWLPDGRSLLLEAAQGVRSGFWIQPVGGEAHTLDLGAVQPQGAFSVAPAGAIAFIGATPTHPGELFVKPDAATGPRRLSHYNDAIEALAHGRREGVDWKEPGGFAEDGVLTYPPDFQAGQRRPLVLVIHGGPASASTTVFSPLPRLLAAAGFLVLEPNYRGSTNLGDAYEHAIYRDTGQGPGEDVMAGLAAVEKMGIVDQNRVAVSGWSYGGYMTTWLTGHSKIWKAAVAGTSLTDWVLDYTVAFYQEGDVYMFGGSPWTKKYHDIWRQQSPIEYAANVTAPTLIMGDVGDPNVPLINSYEWYHALRDHGVEVKFFAYPVDTHFPQDIVRETDVYRRWVDWMVTHDK